MWMKWNKEWKKARGDRANVRRSRMSGYTATAAKVMRKRRENTTEIQRIPQFQFLTLIYQFLLLSKDIFLIYPIAVSNVYCIKPYPTPYKDISFDFLPLRYRSHVEGRIEARKQKYHHKTQKTKLSIESLHPHFILSMISFHQPHLPMQCRSINNHNKMWINKYIHENLIFLRLCLSFSYLLLHFSFSILISLLHTYLYMNLCYVMYTVFVYAARQAAKHEYIVLPQLQLPSRTEYRFSYHKQNKPWLNPHFRLFLA